MKIPWGGRGEAHMYGELPVGAQTALVWLVAAGVIVALIWMRVAEDAGVAEATAQAQRWCDEQQEVDAVTCRAQLEARGEACYRQSYVTRRYGDDYLDVKVFHTCILEGSVMERLRARQAR